jgi:hypothetical protein
MLRSRRRGSVGGMTERKTTLSIIDDGNAQARHRDQDAHEREPRARGLLRNAEMMADERNNANPLPEWWVPKHAKVASYCFAMILRRIMLRR